MATAKKAAKTSRTKKKKVMMPVPSIGRTVLFTDGENVSSPAIITHGADEPRGNISIMVLGEAGSSRAAGVPFANKRTPGHWSWPEMVAPVEVDADE